MTTNKCQKKKIMTLKEAIEKDGQTSTQCDLKITELFSYRIKQAWYYASKLIFIQNRIHLTQYNVWNDKLIYP